MFRIVFVLIAGLFLIGCLGPQLQEPPPPDIYGKVFIYPTGESVKGSKVSLGYRENGKEITQVISSEDGSYRFTDVVEGDYTVMATIIREKTLYLVLVAPVIVEEEDIKVDLFLRKTGIKD